MARIVFSLNEINLIGRIGMEPEFKYTAGGTPMLKFSLATSRYLGQDKGEETTWHNIVDFGESAEKLANQLTKGNLIYVKGYVRNNDWTDDQGTKHYRTEIVADLIDPVGVQWQKDSGQTTAPRTSQSQATQTRSVTGGARVQVPQDQPLPWD